MKNETRQAISNHMPYMQKHQSKRKSAATHSLKDLLFTPVAPT